VILLALKNQWPDLVVSWDHAGPVPDGHVVFESLDALDTWKAEHKDLAPQPVVESEPVPEEISLRQFLMASDRSGLLATLESLKTNPALPAQTRRDIHFFLEYSNFIERNHPLIAALAPMVGVASEQIDDLFRAASAL
jgi:hypothetical protein